MNRLYIPVISAFVAAALPAEAIAEDLTDHSEEMRIGYAVAENEGLNLGLYIHMIFEGAIEYQAPQTERLAGNYVTRIRFRVGNELTAQNNYVFITDDLEGEPLMKQTVESVAYGWNEVVLDQPFLITSGPLFIGFRYESLGEVLSLDGEADDNRANWIRLSQDAEGATGYWNHQSGGALCIQAVVEGETLPQNDIRIERHNLRNYAGTKEPNPMSVVIRNMGAATVSSLDVRLTVDGEELPVRTIDGLNIGSNEIQTVNIGDLVMEYNNIFDVTVDIDRVNGMPDEYPDDNTVTVSNVISRKDYTSRKVLMEHFSTMQCANCPTAHATVDDALRYRDNVIHVIHHSGFGTDPLTTPEAEAYMKLFTNGSSGIYYAPALSLDRVNMSNYGATDGNHATEGPAFFPRRETLGHLIDTRLSTAALVSVAITHTYDPAARRLAVSVSGTVPNGSPSRLNASDPRLTVMITEDSIVGFQKGVVVPNDGTYVHDRALRHVMTGVWGDPVTFDGDSFDSGEYVMTIPAEWNDRRLRIVAFMSDYDPVTTANWQVYNADEVCVETSAGITSVSADRPSLNVAFTDGILILPAGSADPRVIAADGTVAAYAAGLTDQMSLQHLAKGIYIVTAVTPDGTLSAKIAIH